MKEFVLRATMLGLFGLSSPAPTHASPSPADSVNPCALNDCEQWARDRPRAAAKRLLDEEAADRGGFTPAADLPYHGTIWIDPDIITPSDPTALQNIAAAGRGERTMFDRRVNDWITVNAYLFNARFDDRLTTEIQVNPEFGSVSAAMVEANKYGRAIGQLPTVLRTHVETVWIHKGEGAGGGQQHPHSRRRSRFR